MTGILLDPTLQDRLEEVAHYLRRPPAEVVGEAVAAHLYALEAQKLATETAAFEAMHPTLVQAHPGEYVAIHEGRLVDSDPEFETLFQRIRDRFGKIAVLIRQVEEQPTAALLSLSLRLEPE